MNSEDNDLAANWSFSTALYDAAGNQVGTPGIVNDGSIIPPPCPVPTNVRQVPGLPANCHITWDPIPEAIRYDVIYKKNDGVSPWTRIGALNPYKTLHNLDPTAQYIYRVRSYCGTWDFANATGFHYFNMANAQSRENQFAQTAITSIAPNPARNVLNVGLSTETRSDVNLSIVDMMGKTVYQNTINNMEGFQNETIDISNLGQGCYMLVMQSNDQIVVEKFATVR